MDALSCAAIENGAPGYRQQYRARMADGEIRWLSEQAQIRPLGPDRWRIVGVVTDITDLKRAEAALRAGEMRFRAIFEHSMDAIGVSRDGVLAYCNPAYLRLFGFDRLEGAVGVRIPDLVAPAQRPEVKARTRRRQEGDRKAETFEARGRRVDGGEFDMEVHTTSYALDGTEYTVAIIRDITERKQAEAERQAALLRQRVFLQEVLTNVTDGKLRLCETAGDLPAPWPAAGEAIQLMPENLRLLRRRIRDVTDGRGFPADRSQDLLTAASEAGMNAITHAGGGEAQVRVDERGRIQVWVVDHGPGIAMEQLPRAAFERGYTTAGTMGHGLKMMLQTVDRLWLLTGPAGTTVVLEQERTAPLPPWLQDRPAARASR